MVRMTEWMMVFVVVLGLLFLVAAQAKAEHPKDAAAEYCDLVIDLRVAASIEELAAVRMAKAVFKEEGAIEIWKFAKNHELLAIAKVHVLNSIVKDNCKSESF